MIGIIPAAGVGERIQPLGCSKELLPVGSRIIDGVERPKAVSEYLVERMIAAGATQICIVISAEKSDIVRYFAERDYSAEIFYLVQRYPRGLCDALFRAEPFACQHDQVLVGLPDTIWFPENCYRLALAQASADVNLILFPVSNPAIFDAVVCDGQNFVEMVEVKQADAHSHWIWGGVMTTGEAFRSLKLLWESRHREDEYLGYLLNAYIKAGNPVRGHFVGETYMDVGTIGGYHAAQDFLRGRSAAATALTRLPESAQKFSPGLEESREFRD